MNEPQPEGHMASHIGRRKFLATLGGAAAWPFAARAQQPALPVIGYLNFGSPEFDTLRLTGLRRGLSQTDYGFLENPNNPAAFEVTTRDVLAAARVIGLRVQVLKASNDREIDAAFVSLAQARTRALLVPADLFFNNRIERLIELAAHHGIPT